MAKLIALEWDQNELRLAAGSRHGATVTIDLLTSVSLASETALTPDEFDSKLAAALRKLVTEHGLARSEAIVAAGRAAVELRGLSLPPADENDLPDMVRFAAQRAFAQLGDNWPIDFVKFPNQHADSIQVIASAMNSSLVAKIKKIVEQAGLVPKSIMLRPLASTALALVALPLMRNKTCLIVNVVGEDADLLVAQDGVANVIRTARLPQGNEESCRKALAAEIKRTWFASESQTPTMKPTELILWGEAGSGSEATQFLGEATKLPTSQIRLSNAAQLPTTLPAGEVERFVPVVGLIWQATHGDKHAFDFLHPRQRVETHTPIWKKIAGVAAGILAVALAIGWYINENNHLNSEIKRHQQLSKSLDNPLKAANEKIVAYEEVLNFMRADVQWLDQLAYLSEKSPPSERVFLKGTPTFLLDPKNSMASITPLIAAAKNENDLRVMIEAFQDEKHKVFPSKRNINDKEEYSFEESIKIEIASQDRNAYDALLAVAAKEKATIPSPPVEETPPTTPSESAPLEPASEEKGSESGASGS